MGRNIENARDLVVRERRIGDLPASSSIFSCMVKPICMIERPTLRLDDGD